MNDFTQMTIRCSLRNMFNKGWLDICTIKECLKLARVVPPAAEMDHLQALHCVHFKDMDRELAEAMPSMVSSLFEGLQLNADDLFKSPQVAAKVTDITPSRKGVLQLLGIK